MSLNDETVLLHAGALQRATNLSQLMRVTRDAVFAVTRYRHAWRALFEGDNPSVARCLGGDEGVRELGLEHCQAMPALDKDWVTAGARTETRCTPTWWCVGPAPA